MSNLNPILSKLEKQLKGKVTILGIGNRFRGDDGFGAILAQSLKTNDNFKVWDAGSAPENFLGKIVKEEPDTILFIDAVDFNGNAGEITLWDLEDIKTKNFFVTHNTSLNLISDFFKKNTKAKIYLLALQPKTIGFGLKISPEVKERLEELRLWFLNR